MIPKVKTQKMCEVINTNPFDHLVFLLDEFLTYDNLHTMFVNFLHHCFRDFHQYGQHLIDKNERA